MENGKIIKEYFYFNFYSLLILFNIVVVIVTGIKKK